MPVTEYERNQLFAWFDEHMGKERAATMMSLLPPVGWGDVATKRDLDVLAERLDTKIDVFAERLDTKIDAVAAQLDTKIDAKFDVTTGQMATMATKDDLRDLQRTFVTWLLTAQATVVAVVGLLLIAVR
jgi:hypothetical protein